MLTNYMPGTICFIRLFSFYFCRNPVQGTIIMSDIRFLMSGTEGDVMTGERHYWGGGWGFITRHKGVSPPPLWWGWGGGSPQEEETGKVGQCGVGQRARPEAGHRVFTGRPWQRSVLLPLGSKYLGATGLGPGEAVHPSELWLGCLSSFRNIVSCRLSLVSVFEIF